MQRGSALDLQAEDVSVRASIGSSYRAVSGAARSALSRLAVTAPGTIAGSQLADLAGGSAAAELAAAGLLAPVRMAEAGEHYSIHPLVRAYAAEQLLDNASRPDAALTRKRAV
jgi:hypothetical protein